MQNVSVDRGSVVCTVHTSHTSGYTHTAISRIVSQKMKLWSIMRTSYVLTLSACMITCRAQVNKKLKTACIYQNTRHLQITSSNSKCSVSCKFQPKYHSEKEMRVLLLMLSSNSCSICSRSKVFTSIRST